jgi:hypothetical protein
MPVGESEPLKCQVIIDHPHDRIVDRPLSRQVCNTTGELDACFVKRPTSTTVAYAPTSPSCIFVGVLEQPGDLRRLCPVIQHDDMDMRVASMGPREANNRPRQVSRSVTTTPMTTSLRSSDTTFIDR